MNMPEPEWRDRTDFHEFAEALGVTTLAVMAVVKPRPGWPYMVLYTPDLEHFPRDVWSVLVTRGEDSVLRVTSEATLVENFWDEFHDAMKARLEERPDLERERLKERPDLGGQ